MEKRQKADDYFKMRLVGLTIKISNKMDNSLLAVRDINHKYIVVETRKVILQKGLRRKK